MISMYTSITLITVVILVTFSRSEAQQTDELNRCANIENSIERLACYDGLVASSKKSSPADRAVTQGAWRISTSTSPMDDTPTALLHLSATGKVGSGLRKGTPVLNIRCMEGDLAGYIDFGFFIGSNTVAVEYRYDRGKKRKRVWGMSTDRSAIFFPGGQDNQIAFVKKLNKTDRLLVRLTPYGENPILAEFQTAGLQSVLHHVEDACSRRGYLGSVRNLKAHKEQARRAEKARKEQIRKAGVIQREKEKQYEEMRDVWAYFRASDLFGNSDRFYWDHVAKEPLMRNTMIVQAFLRKQKLYTGDIDGRISQSVKHSLEQWQAGHSFVQTPSVDANTVKQIWEIHKQHDGS